MAESSRKAVYAAIIGNFLVFVTKLGAALFTHSSAMLSEAVHSLVDTGNEALLLYGMHRAKKPPDAGHPLGHGREVYFWSFMVAVLIFALGGGVSMYEGVRHMMHPEPMKSPMVNYVVLGLAALFEGGSWLVALREFRRQKGRLGYFEAAQRTKDPATLMVLLEDSAALIGLAIAFAGTLASEMLDMPILDGAASLGIGLLLAGVAAFLARENKQLLIGEAARGALVDSVARLARTEKGVAHFNGLLTVQLSPHQVVVALSVHFDDDMPAREVQRVVASLEASVRRQHPEVVLLLVKPQSAAAYEEARAHWMKPGGSRA